MSAPPQAPLLVQAALQTSKGPDPKPLAQPVSESRYKAALGHQERIPSLSLFFSFTNQSTIFRLCSPLTLLTAPQTLPLKASKYIIAVSASPLARRIANASTEGWLVAPQSLFSLHRRTHPLIATGPSNAHLAPAACTNVPSQAVLGLPAITWCRMIKVQSLPIPCA